MRFLFMKDYIDIVTEAIVFKDGEAIEIKGIWVVDERGRWICDVGSSFAKEYGKVIE